MPLYYSYLECKSGCSMFTVHSMYILLYALNIQPNALTKMCSIQKSTILSQAITLYVIGLPQFRIFVYTCINNYRISIFISEVITGNLHVNMQYCEVIWQQCTMLNVCCKLHTDSHTFLIVCSIQY